MSDNKRDVGPKIVIREWNVIAHWDTLTGDDVFCFICRNKLTEPSLEYEQNPCDENAMGLQRCHGKCGHVFHADCVQRWCKISTDATCTRCGVQWQVSKTEPVS